MLLGELVVVDAVDHGEVGAFGRGRDDHLLGAGGQMRRGLFLGGEDAGAFEHDVDAHLLVRQLRRILDRRHLEALAADVDGVAIDLDLVREAAVHAVEAQQVGVGLDRAEIVDGNDFDIVAAAFDDGAEDVAADAAKTIDCDADCHGRLLKQEDGIDQNSAGIAPGISRALTTAP